MAIILYDLVTHCRYLYLAPVPSYATARFHAVRANGTGLIWFGILVFNGTFSTNRLYRVTEYEIYHVGPGDKTNTQ